MQTRQPLPGKPGPGLGLSVINPFLITFFTEAPPQEHCLGRSLSSSQGQNKVLWQFPSTHSWQIVTEGFQGPASEPPRWKRGPFPFALCQHNLREHEPISALRFPSQTAWSEESGGFGQPRPHHLGQPLPAATSAHAPAPLLQLPGLTGGNPGAGSAPPPPPPDPRPRVRPGWGGAPSPALAPSPKRH